MARIRTIKPDFFTDEKLSQVSRDARLLFIGLLVHADDMGRQQYSPVRLKNQIFPADQITEEAVERWIDELAEYELIRVYKNYSHTQRYIWIPGFLRHQSINKRGHSTLPPHPKDFRPDCRCGMCTSAREAQRNGLPVPDKIRRIVDSSNSPRELAEQSPRSVPAGTIGIPHSGSTGVPEDGTTSAEVGSRKWEVGISQVQHLHTHNAEQIEAQGTPPLEKSEKDRRTAKAATDQIAKEILASLEIPPNQLILLTLTKSIEVLARTKGYTSQAAAQQIWSRAALLAGSDSIPEDWELWFADARYEYVKQGDSKLKDRRLEARPVCGGDRCSEGWEAVRVNGHDVLRRCPQCAQLWRDEGYSSE